MRIIRFCFWYTIGYVTYQILSCIPFFGKFFASMFHAIALFCALAPDEAPHAVVNVPTPWDEYKTNWLG